MRLQVSVGAGAPALAYTEPPFRLRAHEASYAKRGLKSCVQSGACVWCARCSSPISAGTRNISYYFLMP